MARSGRRGWSYVLVAGALALGAWRLRGSEWTSGATLHLVLETASAAVALAVGILALLRFHAAPRARLLFIGAGFLGAGLLDAHHALATVLPSPTGLVPATSTAWSWLGSRLALSLMLFVGYWVGQPTGLSRAGWTTLSRRVYLLGACMVVLTVATMALAPLPPAQYTGHAVGRPQDLVPGALFLAALAEHLREGRWTWDPLKHALVLSLLLGAAGQILFMPFSQGLHDAWFDAAHGLKLLSYLAVFAGLMTSLAAIFRSERDAVEALEASRAALALHQDDLEALVEERTRELARSDARFRRLFESNILGVAFWHIRGPITGANEEFLRMVGATRQEMEAGLLDWRGMTPREHLASDRRALDRLEEHGAHPPFEKEFLHRDGRRVPVILGAALLDGSRDAVVAFVLDITPRVEARRTLQRLNRELEGKVREQTAELRAINHELEAFAYTVSHDLRAPCRQVDGFSRILLAEHADALPEEARRLLGLLRVSALRMGTMVDELLEYSRTGRTRLAPEPLDPTPLVTELAADLRDAYPDKPPAFEIGRLPACKADPTLLRQVWANLLENAAKFTAREPEPLIQVGALGREDRPVYFVADNGVGFDMRHADKLFGVFQRLHAQAEFPGIGIGLATVQRIVHRHGGTVWARGQPGAGATFFFTLHEEAAS